MQKGFFERALNASFREFNWRLSLERRDAPGVNDRKTNYAKVSLIPSSDCSGLGLLL